MVPDSDRRTDNFRIARHPLGIDVKWGDHLLQADLGECAARQSDLPRLAGGTIPFIRRYSIICP
jgi:hypothetical protein